MGHVFPITGVAREDLLSVFPDSKEAIERVSDEDMEYVARKMADGYLECCFWIQLRELGEQVLS